MEQKIEHNIPLRPTIMGLEVGEKAVFPILQLRSVRSLASELGAMFERRYTTCMDREARAVTVTRLK